MCCWAAKADPAHNDPGSQNVHVAQSAGWSCITARSSSCVSLRCCVAALYNRAWVSSFSIHEHSLLTSSLQVQRA